LPKAAEGSVFSVTLLSLPTHQCVIASI
jgi:hypothetical protein